MEATEAVLKKMSNFSLFRGVRHDSKAFAELVGLLKPATFQGRELLIDEKGQDTRMFFLLSGQVQITKVSDQGQVVVLGKADASAHPYFGESILLGKFKKSATVSAYSMCDCATLGADEFAQFLQGHGAEAAAIFGNLATLLFDRLAKANQDLLILGLMAK